MDKPRPRKPDSLKTLDEHRADIVRGHSDPDEVVAEDFTRLELHAAFAKVSNADNWKRPINRRVFLNTARERRAVEAACVFFAGSPVELAPAKGTRRPNIYHVTGAGYYACIGA